MTDHDDDAPLTPGEQLVFELSLRLDAAFKQEPSISAMNHVYQKLRTGRPEVDRELRDHIGLLYRFEEARPALLAELRASRSTQKKTCSEPETEAAHVRP